MADDTQALSNYAPGDRSQVLAPVFNKLTAMPALNLTPPKNPQESMKSYADIMQRNQELAPLEQQGKAAIEGYEAGEQANIARQYGEGVKANQEQLKQIREQFPHPEFHPTEDNAKDLATMFSVMGLIGTALGSHGRMSAMNAMGSMTGMMKGWKEGRQDLWEREYQKFQTESQKVKDILSDAERNSKEALALLATDRETALAELTQVKASLGSQLAGVILEKKGPEEFVKFIEQSNKTWNDQVKNKLEEKKLGLEGQRVSLEQQRIAQEGRDFYVIKTADGKTQTVSLNKNIDPSKQLPQGATIVSRVGTKGEGGGVELGPNAFLQSNFGIKAKDDKEAQRIMDNAIGLSTINDTIKTFADKDVRTGVAATMSKIKEQLKSITDDKTELTDDQVNQLINGAVDPTDKNAIAIKQAAFNAFAIERAAQGGRVTVQMMRIGGNLLDPTKYTKEGYISLLNGRRGDLFKNLRSANVPDEMSLQIINKLSQQQPSYGSQTPAAGARQKLPANVKLSPGQHIDKSGNKIMVYSDGTYEEIK